MKIKFSNRTIGSLLIIMLTGLLFYVFKSEWAWRTARDNITLGFFPISALVSSLIFSFFIVFGKKCHEVPENLNQFTFKMFCSAIVAIIFIVIYFYAVLHVGFVIGSFLFLTSFIYWLGLRKIKICMLVAFALVGAIFIVFKLLNINLPSWQLFNINIYI